MLYGFVETLKHSIIENYDDKDKRMNEEFRDYDAHITFSRTSQLILILINIDVVNLCLVHSSSFFVAYLDMVSCCEHITKIDDLERLMEVIKQAAREGAMVVYTLADPSMAESARQACKLWGVPSTDILSPITEAVASHLGVSPSGLSRWAPGRKISLGEEYFRRIEAIEFTIKQDDGALPQNLHKADLILAGVSRTGKTPLSIYLAQKGYKVANVPIVMGVQLPRTLFEVDPEKVFALTINPIVLQTIRRARAKSLGFSDDLRSNYSEMDYVKGELEFAGKIFAQNPIWPVIGKWPLYYILWYVFLGFLFYHILIIIPEQ